MIFNEIERIGKEALYSESYVVKFTYEGPDGFWKKDSVTYYSTKKGAHKQVLKRLKASFRKADVTSVVYE